MQFQKEKSERRMTGASVILSFRSLEFPLFQAVGDSGHDGIEIPNEPSVESSESVKTPHVLML